MPVGTYAPGTDHFDLAVDYGGLTYSMFFGTDTNHTPLPTEPPPKGTVCLCPSCQSEGWYAQSPVCRFWRAHCEDCDGTRSSREFDRGRPARTVACQRCAEEWTAAVNEFRRVLRNPAAAARQLRAQALTHRALAVTR
ncbi:hypothetical protein C8D87_114131 [Lentzea atacamensis]|uniref:Uncharacterized protein n=1 Tax=Lentzea atacamensis TaxID=531938 RepID=A0ABX9DW58_9PSEU|nr:hypothetical protein [Lentzea atacamensis]RAS59519.1 hypothetical protein C8D87_114131 [Lentzea atacamensis]